MPCEVAGRFVLVAQEDIARERRQQSAIARSVVDTVGTRVLRCDLGGVRDRFVRVNGCCVGLYSRPSDCLVCRSTPWTRYMHVETVSDGEYDVRTHYLSENDARGVRPT